MQHLRKGKSLALKICDTFDKSAVKNSLWVFVFLRPRYSLRFPRFRLFIYLFFFLKLSSKMFPLNGPRYYGVRWGKQPRVRKHESRPAGPLRWLARKIFFWPIRRRDFKRFWNSFGKSKCPGGSPALVVNFRPWKSRRLDQLPLGLRGCRKCKLAEKVLLGWPRVFNFSVNVLALIAEKTNYDLKLVNAREIKVKNDTGWNVILGSRPRSTLH